MKKLLRILLAAALLLTCLVPLAGAEDSAGRPDWYPADVSAFTDFHDEQAPRVVDTADIFTDAEEAAMLKKIGEIQKTGTDLVVFTDVSTYGLDRGTYAADFHHFNGYGFGDDYNGSVLFICMEPGNRGWWTAATGACRKLYTEKNVNAIDGKLEPYMIAGDYGEGVLGYLDNVSYLYEKGHMPIDPHIFIAPAVAAAVAGLLAAAIAVSIMQSKMKNIAGATEAHDYLVPGTFDLLRREDYFLYSNVTRTRISSDSSRGSGGGSSFSGGHSSSGGRSYSGGGRSF